MDERLISSLKSLLLIIFIIWIFRGDRRKSAPTFPSRADPEEPDEPAKPAETVLVRRIRGRIAEIRKEDRRDHEPSVFFDIHFYYAYTIYILPARLPAGRLMRFLNGLLGLYMEGRSWTVVMNECPYEIGQVVELDVVETEAPDVYEPASYVLGKSWGSPPPPSEQEP